MTPAPIRVLRAAPPAAVWLTVTLLTVLCACSGDGGGPSDAGAAGGGVGAAGGGAGAAGGGASGGGAGATGGGAAGGGAGATGGGAAGGGAGAAGGGATGGGVGATGGGAANDGGQAVDAGVPLFGVSAMAIGGESTCAVFDGGLVCLGMVNAYSGIVGTTRWGVPGLSGGSGVISAATHDDHGCALLQTGALRCFGRNDYGQLGDGTTMDHPFAVTVQGVGTGATAISVGFSHSCAIIDGGVKCWGSNSGGELGLGSTGLSVVTPTAVLAPDAGTAVAVRCGTFHTCAVFDKNGARSMRCWGFNSKGQLGSGDQANTSLPTAVVGLPAGALRIAPGYQHTCATVAGGAQCWGWNRLGQLGNGNALTGTNDFVLLPGPVSAPASLTPLAEPTALVSGSSHTCAILDGGAWCWGDNQNHQLANIPAGGAASRPVAADGLSSGVLELGAGTFHTCALVAVGAQRRMRCWGLNTSGQLGQPNTALSTDVPLDVPGL